MSCGFQWPVDHISFAKFFFVIRHFHISHNAPYLPPKILRNLCDDDDDDDDDDDTFIKVSKL